MGIESRCGFTLIEVLTSLFITSIVSISVYSLFISFHGNFNGMIITSEINHNTVSALQCIVKTLKTAGNDPYNKIFSHLYPPIRNASEDTIHFEMDITDISGKGYPDGVISGTKESIIFSLYDSGSDGDLDLGRKREGGKKICVAENIEKLGFFYFDDKLKKIENPADTKRIRSVLVAVLGRSSKKIKDYKNNKDYSLKLPDGTKIDFFKAKNDSYKRNLLSSFVYLNNME